MKLFVIEASLGTARWIAAVHFSRAAVLRAIHQWSELNSDMRFTLINLPVFRFPFAVVQPNEGQLYYLPLFDGQKVVHDPVDPKLTPAAGIAYVIQREFISERGQNQMLAFEHVHLSKAQCDLLVDWSEKWLRYYQGKSR